ncbi:hypothetical protein LINPERPRIM_LOCUS29023 [Linum perenne]
MPMRIICFNGESDSKPYTPTTQSSITATTSYGFYSPGLRGDFGVTPEKGDEIAGLE